MIPVGRNVRTPPQNVGNAGNVTTPNRTAQTGAAAGAAANTQVAHESNTFRPLTAGEIKPGERVIKEFPNPAYGAAKLNEIALLATGEASEVLKRAAAAADKLLGSTGIGMTPRAGERPDPSLGRLMRQARVINGQTEVRTVFQPASGRPTNIDPRQVEGVPNGANIKLKPDGGVDIQGARPLSNMIGTVEKRGGDYFVLAQNDMAPLRELKLDGGTDELIGKLVVVDVQNATTANRKGQVHDVITPKNEMMRLELTIAANGGVPVTFPAPVLAELKRLRENPPTFELKPGMRDQRNLKVIATDNPGSRSDYRSVDPEQASNVSFENGRLVLTDFLANRKLIAPDGSAIDTHAMAVMQTFYGSGFDAAAMPAELSEDLAVFLQDKPRYATAVKGVYDVIPISLKEGTTLTDEQRSVTGLMNGTRTLEEIGTQLGNMDLATKVVRELSDSGAMVVSSKLRLEDSEVYDALITNSWAGSYRDADKLYAQEAGDTQFDATVNAFPDGVKDQLDAFKFAGNVLRQQAKERGQLNAGNTNDGRYQSEQIREAFSTNINEVIALIGDAAGVDTIGRFHPEAKEEKLSRFREFASAFGVPWPSEETFAAYVDKIPERVTAKFPERPEEERTIIIEAVKMQAYRSLEKAIYSVDGGGHAGLAKAKYAHGSASNRQNTGKPNLDNATFASEKLQGRATGNAPYSRDKMIEIAEHATDVELLYARVLERQIDSTRQAVALKPMEGQTLKAVVIDVNPGGVMLQTLSPSAKVFVPLAALGDNFRDRFDMGESKTKVTARNRGVSIEVAQTLDVQIKLVDTELGVIDAMPVLQAREGGGRDDNARDNRNDNNRGRDNGNRGGNDRSRNDRDENRNRNGGRRY